MRHSTSVAVCSLATTFVLFMETAAGAGPAAADPLPAGAIVRLGSTRLKPGGQIHALVFSPDGRRLASWTRIDVNDSQFQIWNVADGRELRKVELPDTHLAAVAWPQDGHGVAVLVLHWTTHFVWDFADEAAPRPPRITSPDPKPNEPGDLRCVAISPDGKWLATGRFAGVNQTQPVELWEVVTNKPLDVLKKRSLGKQRGHGTGLAFSPDGQLVFTLSRGQGPPNIVPPGQLFRGQELPGDMEPKSRLVVREVATGKVRSEFDLPAVAARLLPFQIGPPPVVPDLQTVITGHDDGQIRIWNWEKKEELRSFRAHEAVWDKSLGIGGVYGLCLAQDGKTLVSSGEHDGVQRWDLIGKKSLGKLEPAIVSFPEIAVSPDGKVLAGGDMNGAIRLWDLPTDVERLSGAGHMGSVDAIFPAPDGKTALTASSDGTVRTWDLASGRELSQVKLNGQRSAYWSTFSNDGRQFFESVDLCDLTVWDTTTGKRDELAAMFLFGNRRGPRPALADAVLRDHAQVCGLPTNGGIIMRDHAFGLALYDWPAGTLRQKLATPAAIDFHGFWRTATLSANGKRIAASAEDLLGRQADACLVGIWDATNGASVATLSTSAAVYRLAAFTPDGAALVVGGGGHLGLADSRPSINPAEALIVLDPATADTKQRLLPLGAKFDTDRQVEAVAVSPDGRLVAAAERDHTVWLYDLGTGQIRHRFAGHSGAITSLAFTADGRRLISASRDLTALVWDVGLARSGGIAKPEAKDFDRLWADLSRPDWPTASSAMEALVAHPDVGIAMLRDRLHSAAATGDSQTIDRLVTMLDSSKFAEREQASRDLTALGPAIRDDLRRRAEKAKSAEMRERLQKIVADLAPDGKPVAPLKPDVLRQVRAVEVLEQIATPAAREHLRKLAGGAGTARLSIEAAAALRRLGE